MKLVRTTNTRFLFRLGEREARLLIQVLQLYPRVPPAHHVLSKSARLPHPNAGQRLLNEALAEQRAANRKEVRHLLADPRRFARSDTGARLSLSHADLEWLLQILNDVRIGSWISLGSPEEEIPALTKTTAPHLLAMDMAGHFQAQLLEALHGGPGA